MQIRESAWMENENSAKVESTQSTDTKETKSSQSADATDATDTKGSSDERNAYGLTKIVVWLPIIFWIGGWNICRIFTKQWLKTKKFTDVLYNTVKIYAESDKTGTFDRFVYDDGNILKSRFCVGTVFHVDFTKFDDDLYTKLLGGFQNSMKVLVAAGDVIDTLVNSLTPSKRYQISYVVCNFMYLLVAAMHDDTFCNMIEHTSDYYKMVCESHSAVYNEEDDNPDDFW